MSYQEIDFDLNDCIMGNTEEICRQTGLNLANFTQWDTPLGDLVGMTSQEWLTWAYKTPATQLSATPHPGVSELFQELKRRGHIINIVTATCLTCSQIIYWLDKYNIPFDNVVKASIKLGETLLVDDNPQTLRDRIDLGLPVLKFERPWNEGIDCPSFSDWRKFTSSYGGAK